MSFALALALNGRQSMEKSSLTPAGPLLEGSFWKAQPSERVAYSGGFRPASASGCPPLTLDTPTLTLDTPMLTLDTPILMLDTPMLPVVTHRDSGLEPWPGLILGKGSDPFCQCPVGPLLSQGTSWAVPPRSALRSIPVLPAPC